MVDKRGLNKHGRTAAAPPPMEGQHTCAALQKGSPAERKTPCAALTLFNSVASEFKFRLWHATSLLDADKTENTTKLMPAMSEVT